MAYFYGTTQGHRTPATRCGTKDSRLKSTANSWTIGGEVAIYYDSSIDADIVQLYVTNGSNGGRTLVASFAEVNGKRSLLEHNYPELLI